MNTRLLKEGRVLVGPWIVISVAAFLVFMLVEEEASAFFAAFVLIAGSVFLSALSFGHELNQGTFGQLLAQPISRESIWFEKMMVLWLALLPWIGAVAVWTSFESTFWFMPVVILALGPWLTLRTRDTFGGAVLTLATLVLAAICFMESASQDILATKNLVYPITFSLLTAVGYICGFRYFRTMELAGSDRNITGIAWFPWKQREVSEARPVRSGRPWAALVAKELRLQQTLILGAVVVTAAVIALMAVHWAFGFFVIREVVSIPICLYAMVVPLFIGAISVADERMMGMHGWNLSLTVSARAQWIVKIGVALSLLIVFGMVFPNLLLAAAHEFYEEIPGEITREGSVALTGASLQLMALVVATYASTLSTSTVRAIMLAIALFSAHWAAMALVFALFGTHDDSLIIVVGSFVFSGALLAWFSCANFRRLDRTIKSRWPQVIGALSPLLLLISYKAIDRYWVNIF